MSLSFDYSTERDRQHAKWKMAKARIAAAAVKQAKSIVETKKAVSKIEQLATPVVLPLPIQQVEGRDWLEVQTQSTYAISDIVKEVCRQFGVTRNDIESERRHTSIVNPRQVAMTLAKHLTTRSLPEIGRKLGGRDHTTVLHACRKMQPITEVLRKQVVAGSPINVWVSAFKAELWMVKPAKRKRSKVQAIENE